MLYYTTAQSTNITRPIMKNQFHNSLIRTMATG